MPHHSSRRAAVPSLPPRTYSVPFAVNPAGFVRASGRFVCSLTLHWVTWAVSATAAPGAADALALGAAPSPVAGAGSPMSPRWTVFTGPWALEPPMSHT